MSFRIDSSSFIPLGERSSPVTRKTQHAGPAAPSFDQVRISSPLTGMERRIQDLTGCLSQQIRSWPTAHEVAVLQEQVDSGTYRPNAEEIAKRMLLMQEA